MTAPRITLLVLAYRQAGQIAQAVRGALSQACEPIEIILSDDASPDGTYEAMVKAAAGYAGPHDLVLNRNEQNLGIGRHYNSLIAKARGELLVTQAGDDVSLPDRVARLVQAWDRADRRPDLIASHLVDMAADGKDVGVLRVDDLSQWRSVDDWLRKRPYVIGAAHAFTKRLHRRFGPFLGDLTYEDQANVLRALGSGGAITVDEPLVRYRRGGLSGSLQHFDGAAFLAWSRRRNQGHLALHQQWLRDARLLGCEEAVDGSSRSEHVREQCLNKLLSASNKLELWLEALKARDVPLAWRLRKAFHFSWPELAARRYRVMR